MKQLSREDVRQMTPQQVAKAALEGRFNAALGLPVPFDPDAEPERKEQAGEERREKPTQLGLSTFLAMHPEKIPAAIADGHFQDLAEQRPELFKRYTGTLKERLDCMSSREVQQATRRGDFDGLLGGR